MKGEPDFIFIGAPLQGCTEAVWRRWHCSVFGGVDEYVAPFARVEKGGVRRRDLADICQEQNRGIAVTPQAIFRDTTELRVIVDEFTSRGYRRIDLNMGCPFGPQMSRGRGAAMIIRPDALEAVARELENWPGVAFSIKMRPGVSDFSEWEHVAPILNDMRLRHITVHPRTATMGYRGAAQAEVFGRMAEMIRHPLVYNGDILTPDDITSARRRWPRLRGAMAGRGLIARPWLAADLRAGVDSTPAERAEKMTAMHRGIFRELEQTLCGPTQLLMKIKPLWEYSEGVIGHKAAKAIRKAGDVKRYLQAADIAIAAIGSGINHSEQTFTTNHYPFTI